MAVVLLGGIMTPRQACACSCAAVSEREAFRNADVVFTGRLVDRVRPLRLFNGSDDPVTLVFDVEAVNKGEAARRQSVVTASSEGSCGIDAQKGRKYLVFADRVDGRLRSDLCGGTRQAGKPLAVPSAPGRPPTPGEDVEDSDDLALLFAVGAAIVGGLVVALLRLRRR
ncbi:hypothetical protein [Actinomadura miaoliensis]|uniref:hypothetical protein n=1 Tax=Actinomadura miaoliensis TaxID=430685 RepID=UPI0031F0CD79